MSKTNRKQEILEVLAIQLESNIGSRITTAVLAKAVGVSEAALYRHFPSKAKMFEALIEFAEDSVFGLINQVMEKEPNPSVRCEKLIQIIISFAEKNPGITRVLIGDALVGENERLRKRVIQFFERLETQLKQILKEANLDDSLRVNGTIDSAANAMLAYAEGKIAQFARTEFKKQPTEYWDEQWNALKIGLFK